MIGRLPALMDRLPAFPIRLFLAPGQYSDFAGRNIRRKETCCSGAICREHVVRQLCPDHSCPQGGGLVQGWVSECCGAEGIPFIEVEHKIQLFKFPLIEHNLEFKCLS